MLLPPGIYSDALMKYNPGRTNGNKANVEQILAFYLDKRLPRISIA